MVYLFAVEAIRPFTVILSELAFRQDIHNSVFMSAMITTSRNDEPLCWEQHSKLLPGVSSIVGNNVTKWGQEDVAAFVKTLPGCEEHANTFIEEVQLLLPWYTNCS